MLSSSSYCISHRPLTLPPLTRIRVPNRPVSLSLLNRNFRATDSHYNASKSRWKICCFRQEEFPAENLKPEVVEDILAEELVKPKLDFQTALKKDWRSGFREAAASVFRAIGDRWNVPWTGETILQVMLLWIASFWFVGSWMMPFAAHIAGFSKESLTYRGQAFYSLLTDVTEGLAGIAILHRCLSRFRPLPPGWFKFSLKGNWHFDVALGCLMFPLVNRLSQFNLDILPLLPSTPGTLSSVEQSILARDPVAMGLYVMVVSVCAPIWEEIVFRGFLLPSLTKYMPVWCSILVSSVVFALAHFNVQRMLPLIFLGVVMGALFARTRNLMPSMLLHSLWNAFVFLDLMK
ncbi:uncharacterized protein LOC110722622 [Chenopodium quinoa]|uniref:CAAX prenyl protease 2/Lysostaphin resistance protein A-like domain-containing protein n=1 Tax=Chenopodium quinoa TaxID=63459 RepID=A0A803LWC2_CHEQI|nr:uncharacterized protein LOC110722622 [Chenopodium quinoa]